MSSYTQWLGVWFDLFLTSIQVSSSVICWSFVTLRQLITFVPLFGASSSDKVFWYNKEPEFSEKIYVPFCINIKNASKFQSATKFSTKNHRIPGWWLRLRHAVFKVGHSPWIAAKVAFSEVPPVLFPVEAPWCLSLRFFEIVFLTLLTHIF